MILVAHLLYLQIVSSIAVKQGDFGMFTACRGRNDSLKLKCLYAECPGSPEFHCRIRSFDPPFSVDKCNVTIANHATIYGNTTTTYNCTLLRKDRTERKNITVDYSVTKGKDHIPPCKEASCTVHSPGLVSLWSLLMMMWTNVKD